MPTIYQLYSSKRNENAIGMLKRYDETAKYCHHQFKCFNPRCSRESMERWAKRERACMGQRLLIARKVDEHFTWCGNCDLPSYNPNEIKKTLASFTRMMKNRDIQWRYIIEVSPKGKLHFHFVMISEDYFTVKELKAILHHHTGTACYIEKINSIAALTRYITGDCYGKRKRSVFSREWKVRLTGGTKGFYDGGIAAVYKKLARKWHAMAVAERQLDLEHLDMDYYYALADGEYKAEIQTDVEAELVAEVIANTPAFTEQKLQELWDCSQGQNSTQQYIQQKSTPTPSKLITIESNPIHCDSPHILPFHHEGLPPLRQELLLNRFQSLHPPEGA